MLFKQIRSATSIVTFAGKRLLIGPMAPIPLFLTHCNLDYLTKRSCNAYPNAEEAVLA